MDKPCLGKIEGKYSRICSDCPNAAICALIAVSEWVARVNKWYEVKDA